jgi:Uncharacterized protein encoded in hypervariable junctions of pilus gene clusters
MSCMRYKGYAARIEYDERDDIFVGVCWACATSSVFNASSVPELHEAFRGALEDYLADCAEQGITPEKPASGKVMLRIRPEVHAAASVAARAAGKSLNQWADEVFEQAALA